MPEFEFKLDESFLLIKKDKKRLKRIYSFTEDIKAHSNLIRGKIFEKLRTDGYGYDNRIGTLITSQTLNNGIINFYKDRFKITRPPSKGTSDGYRMIFGIFIKEKKFFVYIPTFVYLAEEEGNHIIYEGKKIPVTAPGLKKMVKLRLSQL